MFRSRFERPLFIVLAIIGVVLTLNINSAQALRQDDDGPWVLESNDFGYYTDTSDPSTWQWNPNFYPIARLYEDPQNPGQFSMTDQGDWNLVREVNWAWDHAGHAVSPHRDSSGPANQQDCFKWEPLGDAKLVPECAWHYNEWDDGQGNWDIHCNETRPDDYGGCLYCDDGYPQDATACQDNGHCPEGIDGDCSQADWDHPDMTATEYCAISCIDKELVGQALTASLPCEEWHSWGSEPWEQCEGVFSWSDMGSFNNGSFQFSDIFRLVWNQQWGHLEHELNDMETKIAQYPYYFNNVRFNIRRHPAQSDQCPEGQLECANVHAQGHKNAVRTPEMWLMQDGQISVAWNWCDDWGNCGNPNYIVRGEKLGASDFIKVEWNGEDAPLNYVASIDYRDIRYDTGYRMWLRRGTTTDDHEVYFKGFKQALPNTGDVVNVNIHMKDVVIPVTFNINTAMEMPIIPATITNSYTQTVYSKSGKEIKGLSGMEVIEEVQNINVRTVPHPQTGTDALVIQFPEPDGAFWGKAGIPDLNGDGELGNDGEYQFRTFVGFFRAATDPATGREKDVYLWIDSPAQTGTIVINPSDWKWIKDEAANYGLTTIHVGFQYRLVMNNKNWGGSINGVKLQPDNSLVDVVDFTNRGYGEVVDIDITP